MSQAHTELIEPLLKELQRRNATDVQITVGSPPSITAMHELVVPRSIPIK